MTTPHLNNTLLFRSQVSWWAGHYLLYMVINSTPALGETDYREEALNI